MSEISIKYPKGNTVHAIGSLKFWDSNQARYTNVEGHQSIDRM